jgi:hypothetical protein
MDPFWNTAVTLEVSRSKEGAARAPHETRVSAPVNAQ